jgi:hypothetical protein
VTIANQRWSNGSFQDAKDHVLATLRQHPWMLGKERICNYLKAIAMEIGRTSRAPVADVADFADELQALQQHQGLRGWLWRQRTLGELLAETSIGCRKRSPRLAIGAAALAIMRNPYQAVALGMRTLSWMQAHRSVQAH